MLWPSNGDYADAMQHPERCFADADLQQGTTIANALGTPKGTAGQFGIVFPINAPNCIGVKCFTREVADLQARYRMISQYLGSRAYPMLVDFSFRESGIRVAGTWYPLLRMGWASGRGLNAFTEASLASPDQLRCIAGQLYSAISELNADGIAHGDLQHGNILVDGTAVRLVDYDGMYVPALSGSPARESGHPNFRHPKRGASDYGPGMDRFSLFVIVLSLLALANSPELWKHHDDDNLLFTEHDLQRPAATSLWSDLHSLQGAWDRGLVETLEEWCRRPMSQPPALAADPQALAVALQQAGLPALSVLAPDGGDWLKEAAGRTPSKRRSKAAGQAAGADGTPGNYMLGLPSM